MERVICHDEKCVAPPGQTGLLLLLLLLLQGVEHATASSSAARIPDLWVLASMQQMAPTWPLWMVCAMVAALHLLPSAVPHQYSASAFSLSEVLELGLLPIWMEVLMA